jgi:type IV secretory pathway ATPase VirB11/archaellum biosynthesis ATPase
VADHVSKFLQILDEYPLCDRFPELSKYRTLAELGMLSHDIAFGLLIQLQDVIEDQHDFPNLLHRAPTASQLYSEGGPQVSVGHLMESAEGEQLECRIKLDRPRHILAAGATGGGKTTLLRSLILKVDSLNERRTKTNQSDSD